LFSIFFLVTKTIIFIFIVLFFTITL